MDVVRDFGFLCLGTRMKRLGERLQSDTQRIMDGFGVGLGPALYPPLAAIDRLGPLGVGEIADALGITQPGATRALAQLAKAGLVRVGTAPDDQRRRVVRLTPAGEAVIAQAKREVWPRVEAAVREVCGDLAGPLLDQLGTIEDRLAETPLDRRTPQETRA